MGFIDDTLKGIPLNPVLRERIDILKEKIAEMNTTIDGLAKKNSVLEKKNAELVTKITNLKQQLSKQEAITNDFAEIRGLKIKKLPAGGYEETMAYCFHCNSPLSSKHRTKNLECSKCGYKTAIQARHLSVVLSELKGEETPSWWNKY